MAEALVGAIVLAPLFGVAAALAAANKGSSAALWFLLGLVLGPFALLFALLGCGKRCEVCMTRIHRQATRCPHCRQDVDD